MRNMDLEHVVIAGHGRSGTNLALSLLDCSERTVCRNEPNEIKGVFDLLSDGYFPPEDPESDADILLRTLEQARFLNSRRDNPNYAHKSYVRNATLLLLYVRCLNRLSRHTAGHEAERRLPGLLSSPSGVANCLPVFKILLWPGRIAATHAYLSGQRVIHVMRDPATFLKSWFTRYVHETAQDEVRVFQDNLPSVRKIMPFFGQNPDRLRTFSDQNLLETELWRWRYMNEFLYAALHESERYMHVLYSDLISEPEYQAEAMMKFCGLQTDDAFRSRISRTENIFKPSKSKQPAPDLIAKVVDTVMSGSRLHEVFPDLQSA